MNRKERTVVRIGIIAMFLPGTRLVLSEQPKNQPPLMQPTKTMQLKAEILSAKTGAIVLTSASPSKAMPGWGTKVTISGAGFKSTPQFRVLFTGASGHQDTPAQVVASTDTLIEVKVPAGARTGKIAFEPIAPRPVATSRFQFLILEDPVVTGFSPSSATRGSTVTIRGSKFAQWDVLSARFVTTDPNLTPVQDRLPVKGTNKIDTSFDVVVPRAAVTGVVQVQADLNPAADTAFVQSTMVLTINVPLELTSLDHSKEMRGRALTIQGGGFLKDPALAVYFTGAGGAQDQSSRIWFKRDREIMCYVPDAAVSGKIKVVVGTGAAAVSKVSTFDFNLMEPVQVSGLSPSAGALGSVVRISGKNFLNRSALSVAFWNGSDVANQNATVVAKTDTTIDVIVPGGARGTGKVQVTSGVGQDFEIVSSPGTFTVTL